MPQQRNHRTIKGSGVKARGGDGATQEPRFVNRIEEFAEHDGGEENAEELLEQTQNIWKRREQSRKIKIHARTPDEFTPERLSKAAVRRTTDGRPDMRLASNKLLYSPDPSMRANGKGPDRRFLEHRPDLMQYHKEQGDAEPNVVFLDDLADD